MSTVLLLLCMQLGDHIRQHFLFGRPDIYFEALMMLIMINAFYFSLWVTNFVIVADATDAPLMWKIVSFLPVIASVMICVYTVKYAALLKVSALLGLGGALSLTRAFPRPVNRRRCNSIRMSCKKLLKW